MQRSLMKAAAGSAERASLKLLEKELQSCNKNAEVLFKAAKKAPPFQWPRTLGCTVHRSFCSRVQDDHTA